MLHSLLLETLTHQTNHQQYLTLNTQHIGTIDLSSLKNNLFFYVPLGKKIKLTHVLVIIKKNKIRVRKGEHPTLIPT